jgi:hypothetical protein
MWFLKLWVVNCSKGEGVAVSHKLLQTIDSSTAFGKVAPAGETFPELLHSRLLFTVSAERLIVQIFRFLSSPLAHCTTVQEHLTAYCKYRGVQLFRFRLSPYTLIRTYNSAQNCTYRDCMGALHCLRLAQRWLGPVTMCTIILFINVQ